MKETITISIEKLDFMIKKLESERDEYYKSSAEYIEIDEKIRCVNNIIKYCKI